MLRDIDTVLPVSVFLSRECCLIIPVDEFAKYLCRYLWVFFIVFWGDSALALVYRLVTNCTIYTMTSPLQLQSINDVAFKGQ